jgi:cytochrome P450
METAPRSLEEVAQNYDIHDDEVRKNHFELLSHMRERGPVYRSTMHDGYWVLVGYEAVWQAARDPELFSSASGVMSVGTNKEMLMKPIETDPPEHLYWRRLMVPFFTQRAADSIHEPMGKYADELIDGFFDRGAIEIIRGYALPLEHRAFFRMIMDLTEEDTEVCMAALDDAIYAQEADARAHGWARVGQFCYELWDRRQGLPSDGGLVDTMRIGTIDGRPVTREDFAGWGIMTIAAGAETTPSAIGHLFVHLATYPEVRRRAAVDPVYLRAVVEESLRHQSPSNTITRTVTKDSEFHGQQLQSGEKAVLLWASANRDESLCPHAEAFDPGRDPCRHVAFGAGVHKCIGERHARALMFVAAQRFLARIPEFSLEPGVEIEYMMAQTRGPVSVPVVFPPADQGR